jgi:sugar phosphate isomerase/epimerase
MKLSISTYSLLRWRHENNKTLDDTIAAFADLGAEGIEFSGLDDHPPARPLQRASHLRKLCEKSHLPIVSYCVGAELLTAPYQQRKTIDKLKRHVDIAAELGAPSMRHDVTRGFNDSAKGLKMPHTFAAALKLVAPAIREVADYAQRKGVRTSLENHGFFMQESRRVEKLIKTVAHPNFGLTLDMGNFLCVNEDTVSAVKRLAKYAQMAHVKDFHARPKKSVPPSGWFATPTKIALRGAICGHGVIDIPAEIRLLKRAGYDGYLSLEFEGIEEPLNAVRLGMEYLGPLIA